MPVSLNSPDESQSKVQEGVFRIEKHNPDYTRTVWYRSDGIEGWTTTKLYANFVFTKDKLKTLFSNKDIDAIQFVGCANLTNDKYDKILMIDVTRERYNSYVTDEYKGEDFYKFFTVRDADLSNFPELKDYIFP